MKRQDSAKWLLITSLIFGSTRMYSQQIEVKGEARESISDRTLQQVVISSSAKDTLQLTDERGLFTFHLDRFIKDTLYFSLATFQTVRIPIETSSDNLDLGRVYLEKQREDIQTLNLVELDNESIVDSSGEEINAGLLRASRDLISRRAAFDFSQAFFRIRGYDSRSGFVLINGMPMNRMLRGRPQWNNWGGLNDAFRVQQISLGLEASSWHFGDVLGVTSIDSRPATLRGGYRISTSLSNKTYLARIMATYNKPPDENTIGFTISASGRWGEEGYIDGTGYKAYSAYGSLEYPIGKRSSIFATAILASNIRGSSAAITNEVYALKGRAYNPYWGVQSSKIRNSRIRQIEEPLIMLNYRYQDQNMLITGGLGHQWGKQSRSRLGYYNAPNPQADYYRYLPSNYLNDNFGPNFISARETEKAFIQEPQIDWATLYQVNRASHSGKAHYILYDDVADSNILNGHFLVNWKIWDYTYLDIGSNISWTRTNFYAQIKDLLGADYHVDMDPFSDTLNDLDGNEDRIEHDLFGYSYQIESQNLDTFMQFRFSRSRWSGFLSGKYYQSSFNRIGLFRNGRYPDNSLGKGKTIRFSNVGAKAGLSYSITGRHRLASHAAYFFRAPVLANTYINPRENHEIVPQISDEKISSVDFNYHIQLPKIGGRITAYYTRFQNTADVNFFYVDSGVGSDFVQQVLTGLDKLHKGIELGITFKPTSAVAVTAVASISQLLYASDPNTTINFDTAGPEEDLINVDGTIDLGLAHLKGYHLSRGPSQAISLGVEYRDPEYWWLGTTLNFLTENYIQISPITRTNSFRINPDNGLAFENANNENISQLLAQRPLESVYLVNLNAGKSWKIDDLYLGLFLSISNLLDVDYRTGGFEQSRKGNFGQLYQDNLSGTPSFGPKYWFGYGRTFFLNLTLGL